MPDASTQFRLEITGADNVAAGFDKVKTAVASTSTEAAKASEATKQLGDAHDAAATPINKFASTLGVAARGVSEFSPALGQAVSIIGQATGSITAMEAALGPLGIALGVATTAFSLISLGIDAMSDKQHDAAASLRRDILPALDDLISKANQAEAALNVRARVQSGRGSETEQSAFTQEGANYVRSVQDRMNRARAQGRDTDADLLEQEFHRAQRVVEYRSHLEDEARHRSIEAEENERLIADQRRQQRELQYQIDEAQGSGNGPRSGGRSGSSSAESQARAAQEKARLMIVAEKEAYEQEQRLDAAEEADRIARAQRGVALEQQMSDRIHAIHVREYQQEAQLAAAQAAQRQAAHERRVAQMESEIQQGAQLASQIVDIFQQAGNAQGNFGKNLAAGFKAELEGLGKTELIKGLSAEAEAIGLSILNPPAAGAKAIEGAQHLAASALAFGGAAVAGAAAGGGAGGSAPIRPTATDSGGARSSSGGGDVHINILGPMIASADKAGVGRLLADSLRAAGQRTGVRADGLPA